MAIGEVISVFGVQTKGESCDCPIHGAYVSNVTRIRGKIVGATGCPKCEEIRIAEEFRLQEKQLKEAQARQQAEELELALKRSRIPADYKNKTFETFIATTENQKGALALSKRFVKGFDKAQENGYGLLFHGSCGTGKSHLACSILKCLIKQATGLYVRTADIIRYVRSTWGKSSDISDFEAVRQFAEVDLLVIDEIGVQAGSENEQQILFSVIDARLSENRPTIFITNLEPDQLPKVLGARLADRIKGKSVPYRFTGKSHRQALSADVFGAAA